MVKCGCKKKIVCEIEFPVLQALCMHHNQLTDECRIDVNGDGWCSIEKCPFIEGGIVYEVAERND